MMLDFVDFVEENSSLTFFPNAFPLEGADEAGIVKVTSPNGNLKGGVGTAQMQIIIRATHPEKAEQYATDLMKSIHNKTSFFIGSIRVIHLTVNDTFPLYIGKDENDRYKYSFDSKILLEK